MKKSVIFVIIAFILIPLKVFAVSDVDFDITKYNINADVQNNGDVNVCEYIKMDGSYNGYVRDIYYKDGDSNYNPSDLTDISVYLLNPSDMTKKDKFTEVVSANKGDKLKYTVNYNGMGPSIAMFNENTGGESGFVLCYTLKDLVLVHNDVAEIYYNFIPKGFEDMLSDVKVSVNLPSIDDTLRVWAHGAIYGNVEKVNKDNYSSLVATISQVYSGEVLNVRMTFNKNLVSESTRFTNKDELDNIINDETKLADEANELRKVAKRKQITSYIAFGIYLVTLIALVIYSYFKYDKEYKTDFDMEYYRDFPNTYGPEVLERLIKKYNTTNGYSASILYMIYKKAFIVEETSDKKDYVLKKAETFKEPLTKEEASIMEFLLNTIGDGNSVLLSEIKAYGKKESTARKFLNHFNDWKKDVENASKEYNFYDKQSKGLPILIIVILSIISFYLSVQADDLLCIFVFIFSVIGVIYISFATRKSKTGIVEYKKWMAFKKFLVDFGRFNEKELPEIILWEKYLVYATVFGVAKNLEKTMKIKIEAMDNTTDMTDIMMYNYLIRSDLNNTINNSISNAYQVANSTIAASNMSSGSGSGGGFSGGGSFSGGGGGGGGHGF